jgi:hypothetical protein
MYLLRRKQGAAISAIRQARKTVIARIREGDGNASHAQRRAASSMAEGSTSESAAETLASSS